MENQKRLEMYKEEKWEEKSEVKKGNIGERIVNEILSKKGYIIYRPITKGAHKIDFFAHREDIEKRIICIEAKAKRRMAKHTKTGFNLNAYLHYKEIQEKYNIETYVYFIDDFEGWVYGNWLNELGEGMLPLSENLSIRYGLERWILFNEFENFIINKFKNILPNSFIKQQTVIVWDLDKMKKERKLTEDELIELSKYTKENYDYSKVVKYFEKELLQQKINFNNA